MAAGLNSSQWTDELTNWNGTSISYDRKRKHTVRWCEHFFMECAESSGDEEAETVSHEGFNNNDAEVSQGNLVGSKNSSDFANVLSGIELSRQSYVGRPLRCLHQSVESKSHQKGKRQ
jgi:hypothetical protein